MNLAQREPERAAEFVIADPDAPVALAVLSCLINVSALSDPGPDAADSWVRELPKKEGRPVPFASLVSTIARHTFDDALRLMEEIVEPGILHFAAMHLVQLDLTRMPAIVALLNLSTNFADMLRAQCQGPAGIRIRNQP